MLAAVSAPFVGSGNAHAGLDNELGLVDGTDRTLTIQQWDTQGKAIASANAAASEG
jgi:hypothetical protein